MTNLRKAKMALEGSCTDPAADPEQAANEDAGIKIVKYTV